MINIILVTQNHINCVFTHYLFPFLFLVVTSMHQKASELDLLTMQAFQLEEKYRQLLQQIEKLSQNANVEIVKNMLIDILQGKCSNQSHGISSYIELIDKITNMDEVFTFLVKNRFVGYLNYYLLKELSSEVICGDGYEKAQAEVVKYEKHYCQFIEEPSFCHLIEVFDENPHLNPGTVIGLPIVVISLSKKWKTRNKKDLNEWVPFLTENKHLLQSIGYKCILITYAIFPVHLLKVMSFLSNEEHMERLKENGITIETPSYTMEIVERLREVSKEDNEHVKAYKEITIARATEHMEVHKIENCSNKSNEQTAKKCRRNPESFSNGETALTEVSPSKKIKLASSAKPIRRTESTD